MVDAEDAALEMSPETLNGVGGDVTIGILLNLVVDDAVDVAFVGKATVGAVLIREDVRALGNELHDDGLQRLRLGVFHVHGNHVSVSFRHTEYRALRLKRATLRMFCLLAFVLVGFTSTEIHFVAFNVAEKSLCVVLPVQHTNLLLHEPRGLLRNVDVTAELYGGYALLVAADEVHCHEPLAQSNLRIFKDCPYGYGEFVLAALALETSVLALDAMCAAAVGAYDNVAPALFLEEFLALVLGVKVGD